MPGGAGRQPGRTTPQWIELKGGTSMETRVNVTRGSLHNPTQVQMDLTVKASRLAEKVWKQVTYSNIPAEQSGLKINRSKNWPKKPFYLM